ncbi:MAG: hypothetical protein ABJE10_24570 [bacterium]
MTRKHVKGRVGEPVQVFLATPDRERLLELAEQLGASKSDIIRKALVALERELMNPVTHPLLSLIGLVEGDDGMTDDGRDVAREHDAILAEQHEYPRRHATRRKER